MIKAVIFDMGGVILDLDMPRCIRNFKERAGFSDIETYLDVYHQKGFISDLEEGLIDESEFYEECLRHCTKGATADDIKFCLNSIVAGANLDIIRQIITLSKDYPLFILSNNNPVCLKHELEILDEEGVSGCFREFFFSFRMKMLKPGREIYDEVVRRTGFLPEEILFVDDSIANVESARAAGLNAVHYKKGVNVLSECYGSSPVVH